MKSRIFATAFIVLGLAAASASSASDGHAVTVRVDTPDFGIRIGHPGYYPGPVVVAPPPVIVAPPVYAPAPVYMPPPVYTPPRVIYAPAPVIYAPHPGHGGHHRHHPRHRHHHDHRNHHNGHEHTRYREDWHDGGRYIRSVQIRPY